MRRLLAGALAVVGVVATVATSEAASIPLATGATTLDIPLDARRPAADFTITTTVQPGAVASVELRADLRIDDDGDPANDELHLLDVGLLDEDERLPDDVDVAGDASMASVGEGAFGVTTTLEPEAATAGAVTVLSVRLRPGVSRARLGVRLTASAPVAADQEAADRAAVTIAVEPRAAAGSGNDTAGAAQ